MFIRGALIATLAAALFPSVRAHEAIASEPAPQPTTTGIPRIELKEALAISQVASSARSAIRTDAVEALIVSGTWKLPAPGDALKTRDGSERTWSSVTAGDDGWVNGEPFRNGYLLWTFNSDDDRAAILEASGHGMVYVNGEPRAGDPYELGFVGLPIQLRKGVNELLFRAGRGRIRAKIVPPSSPVFIDTRDVTQCDVIAGEPSAWLGAAVVVNTTTEPLVGWTTRVNSAENPTLVPLPRIEPMSVRKVAFRESGMWSTPGDSKTALELLDPSGVAKAEANINITVLPADTRATGRTRRVTFQSQIDGSVQYYAVRDALQPAPGAEPSKYRPGLLLTLHGASVEAKGQVDSYAPKDWCAIVGPTNRRPFGLDWEDWGRLDALEVLDHAQQSLKTDPDRVWLTGHSMGGHGTWQLASTFPDRFAAAAPSAGWPTFWTYTAVGTPAPWEAMPTGGVAELMGRAVRTSDTLGLVPNLSMLGSRTVSGGGVYILHGDADDNVPVSQARLMRDRLSDDGQPFGYHEQPGAGHWWGGAEQGGCVDWAPIMGLFRSRSIPRAGEVERIRFTTMNPRVSSRSYWSRILEQNEALTPSTVDLRWGKASRFITGTTSNVAALWLDIGLLRTSGGEGISRIELDAQTIDLGTVSPGASVIILRKLDGSWRVLTTTEVTPFMEQTKRALGPFKSVIQNRFAYIYGTSGTAAERSAMIAKARFDAETFWYRGNGSFDVVSDTEFLAHTDWYARRNIVLIGNRSLNRAWETVVGNGPIDADSGSVSVGDRREQGDDLACLFIGRRADTEGQFAAIAGSGLSGLRLNERMAFFLSGAGFPDYSLFGPEFLTKGIDGVRATGYFGPTGTLEGGTSAWRDAAP